MCVPDLVNESLTQHQLQLQHLLNAPKHNKMTHNMNYLKYKELKATFSLHKLIPKTLK